LAKVQTVLEIHVNLMSFFQGVRYAFLTKEIKIFERILICVNSKKNSVFVKKFTFTHVDAILVISPNFTRTPLKMGFHLGQ
jgi:hypothetical protein